MDDFNSLGIQLKLFVQFELRLRSGDFRGAEKICFYSFLAGVFSLLICVWIEETTFISLPHEAPGTRQAVPSRVVFTLWTGSLGQVILWEETSSYKYPFQVQHLSGNCVSSIFSFLCQSPRKLPEKLRVQQKSIFWQCFHSIFQFIELLRVVFVQSSRIFFRNFRNMFTSSQTSHVFRQIVPGMFFLTFHVDGNQCTLLTLTSLVN